MPDEPSITIQDVLESQYRAGMQMLRSCIEAIPDSEWSNTDDRNPAWQQAYHVLFYTHMYLQPALNRFKAWEHHRKEYAALGSPGNVPPLSRTQVLEYWTHCNERIGEWVDALDLDARTCGFWWYKMGKLEHQLVNIRHLQHHTAQLADRLRNRADVGIDWAASG